MRPDTSTMTRTRPGLGIRRHLLQREAAETYLFITLLGFAASVSLTRLYLTLTDYPQLGGGDLHIAHVLWGGLLLYVAALLPLLFANRAVYGVAAALAGAGVGLFIDEVGKFITARNDYFFPVSASIIYVLFLLTIVLFLHIRRVARTRSRDELTRVFEDVWEALNRTLTQGQFERLEHRLEAAIASAPSPAHAQLAEALLTFLRKEAAPHPEKRRGGRVGRRTIRRVVGRLVFERTLRVLLIIGLLGIGLLSLKNPASVLLADRLPPGLIEFLVGLRVGRHLEASVSPLWSSMRLGLEVAVGTILLFAAVFLAAGWKRLGSSLASLGLLLSLTTVNILLFYFEQFSTIITTAIQFVLLIGVVVYTRHRS